MDHLKSAPWSVDLERFHCIYNMCEGSHCHCQCRELIYFIAREVLIQHNVIIHMMPAYQGAVTAECLTQFSLALYANETSMSHYVTKVSWHSVNIRLLTNFPPNRHCQLIFTTFCNSGLRQSTLSDRCTSRSAMASFPVCCVSMTLIGHLPCDLPSSKYL